MRAGLEDRGVLVFPQIQHELEDLRVVHTVEASLRPVYGHPSQERIERWRGIASPKEQPLVWTHANGRKSLLVGSHADAVVGRPGAHGRALLWRLQQWAAQPASSIDTVGKPATSLSGTTKA